MKLYVWKPKGFGEKSFYVMAESEDLAREAVDMKIKQLLDEASDPESWVFFCDGDCAGWGTDYYKLTVVGKNEVIMNSND